MMGEHLLTLQPAKNVTLDKNVTLYAIQVNVCF